jgi:adenosyl cobinamide kinase/adenosyl cobinamide phosphate guanylyltransferase
MEEVSSDEEVRLRVLKHRTRRPSHWLTVERTLAVEEAIREFPDRPGVCIFDCLSLYISNVMLKPENLDASPEVLESEVLASMERLLRAMEGQAEIHFIVVTNEVGWGIVPENGLARAYRDLLGSANQIFAQAASEVWLSCVGLPLRLKPQAGNY